MIDSRRESLRWAVLLLLLTLPVLVPALTQDVGARAYDAATEHIYRGVAFSHAISGGAAYPRWTQQLHWGLGSPLFTFQPPLPYYGMDLLARAGLPHPLGWRVLVAAGLFAAFSGAYLLIRDLTGKRWAGAVAAVAYLYAPYVLRNSLERGSNEAYSMMLYPLVLWSLLRLARSPTAGWFVAAVLLWAACIGSHVLGPLMLAPFALVFAAILAWRKRTALPLIALLAGGLLTAAIWAPMVPEQSWVHVERDFEQPEARPADNPIPLDRLLALPPVFDVVRDNNNLGDRAGLLHAAALAAAAFAAAALWRRERRLASLLLFAAAAGILLFWLLTPWSDWFWSGFEPIMGRLLYRTRLMGVFALAAAGALGLLAAAASERWERALALAAIVVLTGTALPSLYVQHFHRYTTFHLPVDLAQVRAMEIRSGGTALTAFGEFQPVWRSDPFDEQLLGELDAGFSAADTPLAAPRSGVSVRSASIRDGAWDLELEAAGATPIAFRLLYYPRWRALLDGSPAGLAPESGTGYATMMLPSGVHEVALRYVTTSAERAGAVVSAATASGLALLGVWAIACRLRNRRVLPRLEAPAPKGSAGAAPLWLLAGLAAILLFKFGFVDRNTTWLRCVSDETRVCGAEVTARGAFSGAPELAGFSVPTPRVAPGDDALVTLYWRGVGDGDRLSSFVHIRRSDPAQQASPVTGGDIWAQQEHVAPGGLLTDEMETGRLYEDNFRLRLPKEMPAGNYFLEAGWYDPVTGEQREIPADRVAPPLRVLWRSVLLPDLVVEGG